jgi:hypothetical protein
MAGRSELQRSPAYRALSDGGVEVLHAVEEQAARGSVAISLERLAELTDLCRSSTRQAIRLCETLGLISVTAGPRRVNEFALANGWRAVDQIEAKRRLQLPRLRTPPRQSSAPPRAVRQAKARVEEPVEQPQPRQPSMPVVAWVNGR